MKRKTRKAGALLSALLLTLMLGGCEIPMPGFADYDVSGYIQALLDSSYHNSHSGFMTVAMVSPHQRRNRPSCRRFFPNCLARPNTLCGKNRGWIQGTI